MIETPRKFDIDQVMSNIEKEFADAPPAFIEGQVFELTQAVIERNPDVFNPDFAVMTGPADTINGAAVEARTPRLSPTY